MRNLVHKEGKQPKATHCLFNGDINNTLNDKNSIKGLSGSFNIDELRRAVKEQMNTNDAPETYQLKR